MKTNIIINNLIKSLKTHAKNNFLNETLIFDGVFEKLVKEKNDKKDTTIKTLRMRVSPTIITNKINSEKVSETDLNQKLRKKDELINQSKKTQKFEKLTVLLQGIQPITTIVEKNISNNAANNIETETKLKVNHVITTDGVRKAKKLTKKTEWSDKKALNSNAETINSLRKNVTEREISKNTTKVPGKIVNSIMKNEQINVEKKFDLKNMDNMLYQKVVINLQNTTVATVNYEKDIKNGMQIFKKIIEQTINHVIYVTEKVFQTGLEKNLTIKLSPPNLGELHIAAKIEDGDNLKIKISAELPETAKLIELGVEELKKELLSVMREKTEGMEVYVDNSGADSKTDDKSYLIYPESVEQEIKSDNKTIILPKNETEKNVYMV